MLLQVMQQASGPSGQEVQDELEVQIENLKNEATKQFDQERYSECLRSFQFLCELEPQNRQFSDYLELCRQMLDEKEASSVRTILVDDYKNFDEVDLESKKSANGNTEIPEPKGVIDESPVSAVSAPSEKSIVDALSRVNTLDIRQKPGRTICLLKRIVRVSALVAGILIFFAMLSHWTHRVRAPQLPDHPDIESDLRQFSGPENRMDYKMRRTKKMEPRSQTRRVVRFRCPKESEFRGLPSRKRRVNGGLSRGS